MSAKVLVRQLENFSTKLWREAIHLEKLTDEISAVEVTADDIKTPRGVDEQVMFENQAEILKRIRNLAFKLGGLDTELQEMAWEVDRIVDLAEALIPSKNPRA